MFASNCVCHSTRFQPISFSLKNSTQNIPWFGKYLGGWIWGHNLDTPTWVNFTYSFYQHLYEMFLVIFNPNQLLWAPAVCSRTLTHLSWSHRFDDTALCWRPVSCRVMSHHPSLGSRAFGSDPGCLCTSLCFTVWIDHCMWPLIQLHKNFQDSRHKRDNAAELNF